MIAIEAIPENELIDTAREMVKIMKARGWTNIKKLYHPGPSYFLANRPDGKSMRMLATLPPTTSAFSYQIAHNKIATYEILKTEKIQQPETILVRDENSLENLLKKHKRLVVKPHNGAHGQKIFANISSVEAAKSARAEIERENRGSGDDAIAIAQEMITEDTGIELRVVCIDYEFVVAFERIPAAVTGDGEHSVSELIDIENKTIRGEAYLSHLSKINRAEALNYLGEKSTLIPAQSEKVRVHPTCNIGQGGTARVVLADELGDKKIKTAETIARLCDLPIVGIDFLGDYVLEINATPGLQMPTGDQYETYAVEKYIEYLEKI